MGDLVIMSSDNLVGGKERMPLKGLPKDVNVIDRNSVRSESTF